MIKKALFALIATSALMAAAAVAVIAAALALFALLSQSLTPSGAAAAVAVTAALIVAVGGLVAALKLRGPRNDHRPDEGGLSGKLLSLARQKPLLATGAAVAVAVIAFRNPKLVTALLTGVLAGKASPKG